MITSQTLKEFRRDFKTAAAELEKKYGLVIDLGAIKYSSDNFRATLTASVGASKEEANKKVWDRECVYYGLKATDFGKTFVIHGHTVKVAGINTNSRKYPIELTCLDGSTGYKMTVTGLKEHLY